MGDLHDPRYGRLRARLREARLGAGLTQVEAAARLGRAQQFVSRCEAGDRRIDALDLADFADLYGRSLDWLLDRETAPAGRRAGKRRTGRTRTGG